MTRDFNDDLKKSQKASRSIEIEEIYEKKLQSKIKKRTEIKDKSQQNAGYDIELHLEDGRLLTIEEKFRWTFYPDLLLEIKHENDNNKIGWLYTSEAEILAYFQMKDSFILTLLKLKELAQWSRSVEFLKLLTEGVIKEKSSETKRGEHHWRTKNYVVPFHILRNKNFEYRNKKYEKTRKDLPLEFYGTQYEKENNKI